MQTLISPERVFRLAFTADEMLTPSVILPADILAVEERHLRPIIGEALYAALAEGRYAELLEEYVAPAVAAWTRYAVQPLLGHRCSSCLVSDGNDFYNATTADNVRMAALQRHLRHTAQTLSRRLGDYLNNHSADFAEYDPDENPLNRCSINGDIVQTY